MPAVSKAQQAYFAIAEHAPSKLRGKKPKLSKKKLHEFAATSTKGLPKHAGTLSSMPAGAWLGHKRKIKA